MSWLRFSKSSDNDCFPLGPSKIYFFSTGSHGRSRLCLLNSSLRLVNSFFFFRNAVRAFIHSLCETTECLLMPLPASFSILFPPVDVFNVPRLCFPSTFWI